MQSEIIKPSFPAVKIQAPLKIRRIIQVFLQKANKQSNGCDNIIIDVDHFGCVLAK